MTMNLNELVRGGTVCLGSAGLKIGNSDTKDVDIAAPNGAGIDFAINGIAYHKADAADIPITAHAVQAALYSCIYLVQLNVSGTLSTVKGTAALTGSGEPLYWPTPTTDNCPIGAVRVDCASGYPFTGGTTDFDATGITDTFYSFFAVPAAPLTA